MMTRLGLTGGIGSGKSTVASMLARSGATVIDADAVSRHTTAANGAAMPAIAREFGASFIASDGGLDRDTMRQHIFNQPAAKTQLEAIIHPLVGQEIQRLTQFAIASGSTLIVFDIPLLVESAHWRPRLDQVMVVDCDIETQIQRVLKRSGWPRAQVLQVIAAQASRFHRLSAADMVIFNQGLDFAALELQVRQFMRQMGASSGYDGA
jgi:dephospho-CoA kinase